MAKYTRSLDTNSSQNLTKTDAYAQYLYHEIIKSYEGVTFTKDKSRVFAPKFISKCFCSDYPSCDWTSSHGWCGHFIKTTSGDTFHSVIPNGRELLCS